MACLRGLGCGSVHPSSVANMRKKTPRKLTRLISPFRAPSYRLPSRTRVRESAHASFPSARRRRRTNEATAARWTGEATTTKRTRVLPSRLPSASPRRRRETREATAARQTSEATVEKRTRVAIHPVLLPNGSTASTGRGSPARLR